jgi:hypothetical protein
MKNKNIYLSLAIFILISACVATLIVTTVQHIVYPPHEQVCEIDRMVFAEILKDYNRAEIKRNNIWRVSISDGMKKGSFQYDVYWAGDKFKAFVSWNVKNDHITIESINFDRKP